MAVDLKTLTPDTSLPTTGFLFGADSQASTNPSVYSTQTVATTLLGSTSLTGDVLTASAPVLNLTQQWNSVGTTFTGLKFNVDTTTYNQSAAASLLMDLQVGTVSKFKVDKVGNVYAGNPAAGFSNTGIMALGAVFGTGGGSPAVLSGEQAVFYASSAKVGEYIFGTRLKNNSAFTYEWSSTTLASGATDLTIGRNGPANLRLGQADAATALAQTLSVQSVVAGTSNTAGAAFTITGSQGTGSGAGGSIIFQVAPAGGSGTAQNTLQTALTINADRSVTVAANASSLAQIAMADRGTVLSIYTTAFGTQPLLVSASGGIAINNDTGSLRFGASQDAILSRAAAGVVQVGTTANNASGTLKAAVVGTTTAYTVATLPTGFQGARAFVTDATSPTYLGALTGGGAVVCPVFYNGTAWVSA
jgi:hypothetical protein